MTRQEKEIQPVLDQLSILEPAASEKPRPAVQALARVRHRVESRQKESVWQRLWTPRAAPRRRPALAAGLLVILFSLAFAFPAVRAAASDFLGLFRVQKFAAVSISPEQIAILQQVAAEGLMPGEFEILKQPGQLTPVASLEEASAIAGFSARSLGTLGEPSQVYVTEGAMGRLTIDLAGSRAILGAAGVDPALLPDSADGQRVDIVTYPGVEQQWADGTMLLQTESPVVEYPPDLEPALLGQALLQVLGMDEPEASRLAQSIDWTTTLLLPVPQQAASFSEVSIGGSSGLALASLDGSQVVIMWQQGGIVYLLSGSGSTADLVSLANSVQ